MGAKAKKLSMKPPMAFVNCRILFIACAKFLCVSKSQLRRPLSIRTSIFCIYFNKNRTSLEEIQRFESTRMKLGV